MSKEIDIEAIKVLLESSGYHDWWTAGEVEAFIRTPMMLGQYIALWSDGEPAVFATWAFPDYEHVVQYTEEFMFPVEGYDGGGKVPWIIDFIAMGGTRNIALGFRKLKSVLSNMGYQQAYGLRTETGRICFHHWGN